VREAERGGGHRAGKGERWKTTTTTPTHPPFPSKGWLLYVHGGGFVAGSPATHRGVTSAFAARGWRVFAADYRRSPEAAFPAPLDDVGAAWAALAATAPPGARLAIAGDSAGGNLALAAALDVVSGETRNAARLPDAIILFSPVTDLTCSGESMRTRVASDAMVQPGVLRGMAANYLGADRVAALARAARVSPLFAPHLGALPPVAVYVGSGELLLDDSTRLTAAIRAAGGRCALSVVDGVPHAWPTMAALMPEAPAAVGSASRFAVAADVSAPEAFDVVIVGAGISGVCAAHRLRAARPGIQVAILEARAESGGTWSLFTYPGIRSDSDMHTFGLPFPRGGGWAGPDTIASGADILAHIRAVADDTGVAPLVRYRHRVVAADWDGGERVWRARVEVGEEGSTEHKTVTITTSFLHFCSGYYSYDAPHRPSFPGEDSFPGPIIHPQQWPPGFDPRGRTIAVIGSGATAVTLVPALVRAGAARTTMVQRSPSHVIALPTRDAVATLISRIPLVGRRLARWYGFWRSHLLYVLSRSRPTAVAAKLQAAAAAALGPGVPADPHCAPRHAVWDERVCVATDGDLFDALREGTAAVVTDEGGVAAFDERGIVLASGARVDADTIVTATGFNMVALGGVTLSVDGAPVDLKQRMAYKGTMLAGVPNAFFTVGYTHAAWTLRADLTARWVARVVTEAIRSRSRVVVPKPDPGVKPMPLLDIKSGYVRRAAAVLPSAGDRGPWRVDWSWPRDVVTVAFGRVRDGVLQFSS